jgi:hypothetical protein
MVRVWVAKPHIGSGVDFSDLQKAPSRIAAMIGQIMEADHEPSPAKIFAGG